MSYRIIAFRPVVLFQIILFSVASCHVLLKDNAHIHFADTDLVVSSELVEDVMDVENWYLSDPVIYYDFEGYANDSTGPIYPVRGHGLKQHHKLVVLDRHPETSFSFVPGPRGGSALRLESGQLCWYLTPSPYPFGKADLTDLSFTFWLRPRCSKCTIADFGYNFSGDEHGVILFMGLMGSSQYDDEVDGQIGFSSHHSHSNANGDALAGGFLPVLNEWVHVGIVKTGVTISFYANGTLTGTDTVASSLIVFWETERSCCLGGAQIQAGTSFRNQKYDGDIDEFRVFTRALSAAEINAEYLR